MSAQPSLEDIIAEIDSWFASHIQRAPLAHDVAIYNQAHAALEHLKARVVELFTGKPADAPAAVQSVAGETATAPKGKATE